MTDSKALKDRTLEKKTYIFILILFLFFTDIQIFAQQSKENSDPPIYGQVLNIEDKSPVVKAVVTNHRTKLTVTADYEGRFIIYGLNIDSLEINSIGFLKQVVPIPKNYSNSTFLVIYDIPLRYLLPDVRISGNYRKPIVKVEKIEVSPYFRNEIMEERPAMEKSTQNQITFYKIPIDANGHIQKKLSDAIKNDQLWASTSKIYNIDLIKKLTGINTAEADRFMMYLNDKKVFDETISKEYVSYLILEQFKIYKQEGH
jgi:hypothetical protein